MQLLGRGLEVVRRSLRSRCTAGGRRTPPSCSAPRSGSAREAQSQVAADGPSARRAGCGAGTGRACSDQDARRGELAATEHEMARTGAAIDRYLTAFENGTLDPEDLAGRLAQLKNRSRRKPRGVPCSQVKSPPLPRCCPPPHYARSPTTSAKSSWRAATTSAKPLIEALVAQVKITGPGRIVPVFRIPQPEADTAAEATRTMVRTATQTHKAEPGVRAMINLVRSSRLAVTCGKSL